MVNNAANVARQQAAEASKVKRRQQAYDRLTAILNGKASHMPACIPAHLLPPSANPVLCPEQAGGGKALAQELRGAIQEARDAGVSDKEVARAEARLRSVSPQPTGR